MAHLNVYRSAVHDGDPANCNDPDCRYQADCVATVERLERELAEARKSYPCEACGGTGKPASGLPCICGGAGTAGAEKGGLRRETIRLREELAEVRLALERYGKHLLVEYCPTGSHPNDPCTCGLAALLAEKKP